MLWKALLTWLIMAVFMVLNGTVRELVYAPQLGAYAGHVISTILGIVIIWSVTWLFLKRQPALSGNVLWRIGALWLGLTVAFEFPFGHFVDGASWQTLLAEYNLLNGRLWLLILLSTALAPPLCGRHLRLMRGRSAAARLAAPAALTQKG